MPIKQFLLDLVAAALLVVASAQAHSAETATNVSATNSIGLVTNGPAVFQGVEIGPPRTADSQQPANIRAYRTNLVFDHFLPESLNYTLFTNLIARTNGRTTKIWSERSHQPGWPNKPPIVKWQSNGLLWGMTGITALSPCWEVEGAPGQVPVTALTRRHGYTRGHSFGAEGFHKVLEGKKIWFLTTENKIIEVKVLREVVRCSNGRDYTILLFKNDLPASIQPLRVVNPTNFFAKCPKNTPVPLHWLQTEQSGNVSATLPEFTINTWKGGDSGSPNLLPMGNELIFVNGRSTSGPNVEMQADLDELCRQAGLSSKKYQLQWADLAKYPTY